MAQVGRSVVLGFVMPMVMGCFWKQSESLDGEQKLKENIIDAVATPSNRFHNIFSQSQDQNVGNIIREFGTGLSDKQTRDLTLSIFENSSARDFTRRFYQKSKRAPQSIFNEKKFQAKFQKGNLQSFMSRDDLANMNQNDFEALVRHSLSLEIDNVEDKKSQKKKIMLKIMVTLKKN